MADLLCLEPIGGIAGDMFLALALDLGVPFEELERELRALPLAGWRLVASRAARHALCGTRVEVVLDAAPEPHGHRSFTSIRQMIERAALATRIKERALRIFEVIARAEAKVHGVEVDEVHFHEVGAVDSIVDAVGAAVALELLGSPDVFCAPPPLGSGLKYTAHGAMPLPAPAVLEILRGRRVRFEGVGELTTPTGAAIAAGLTREADFPEMVIERVGYGLGAADPSDRPNVLRGLLGRRAHGGEEGTYVLEANLDDASGQVAAHALDRALEQGALDAWIAPVTMKKGRPGHILGVLAPGGLRAALAELLLRETTTLGVRAVRVERTALERRFQTVETPWGPVRIKLGYLSGKEVNAAPEYEDCLRLSRERGVPLKKVMEAALACFWRKPE
jgi:uncharacterized protein (TIGR00299 family) protein